MTARQVPCQLIALVADRDMEETLVRLFGRGRSFAIRGFAFEIRRHPDRDAGCRADAVNYLRQFLRTFDHALVVFDRDGCGSDATREEIEEAVEAELYRNGWRDRSKVIVIDPQLEGWIWSGSSVVSRALGWGSDYDQLRSWLAEKGLWNAGLPKPDDPKAAMDKALESASRESRRRRSARIFGEIAARASLHGCTDPAFRKLTATLQDWFPRVQGS